MPSTATRWSVSVTNSFTIAKRLLPRRMRRRMLRGYRRVTAWPPLGTVDLGSLRRTTSISNQFGLDRGQPVDRYYIEDFLRRHGEASGVVRGRVLEIEKPLYARRFGDGARVERIDVLDSIQTTKMQQNGGTRGRRSSQRREEITRIFEYPQMSAAPSLRDQGSDG
jgi:hypothetical protein